MQKLTPISELQKVASQIWDAGESLGKHSCSMECCNQSLECVSSPPASPPTCGTPRVFIRRSLNHTLP